MNKLYVGDCCGVDESKSCGDGYVVTSVPFEVCQGRKDACATLNGCFGCSLSPPGENPILSSVYTNIHSTDVTFSLSFWRWGHSHKPWKTNHRWRNLRTRGVLERNVPAYLLRWWWYWECAERCKCCLSCCGVQRGGANFQTCGTDLRHRCHFGHPPPHNDYISSIIVATMFESLAILVIKSAFPFFLGYIFSKFRKCNLGESLLSCLKAERAIIDSCNAGSAADVEIACNFKVCFSVWLYYRSSYGFWFLVTLFWFYIYCRSVDHFLPSTTSSFPLAAHT